MDGGGSPGGGRRCSRDSTRSADTERDVVVLRQEGVVVVEALSEVADLRKLRREVAETWPEDTSRDMALQVLDALVCKLSEAVAE
jgi:hypothetical protein